MTGARGSIVCVAVDYGGTITAPETRGEEDRHKPVDPLAAEAIRRLQRNTFSSVSSAPRAGSAARSWPPPASGLCPLEEEIAQNTARRAGLSKGDAEALRTIGVDPDEIVRKMEESFGEGAFGRAAHRPRRLFGRREGSPPFSRGAKHVLERSLREALDMRHNYIGTEHIVLGLLSDDWGIATDVLADHDLSYGTVRQTVLDELRRAL